jgi:malate dehydrogenase (oxaloacetate-decarboxylating)
MPNRRGKSRSSVKTKEDLSLAYTPGVAEPCLAIRKDVNLSYEYTRRWNMVAVVTDGTAVLGFGDIGPDAGLPVREGKCVLFKAFGDVDAFPLCIRSKGVDEIVHTVKLWRAASVESTWRISLPPDALRLKEG